MRIDTLIWDKPTDPTKHKKTVLIVGNFFSNKIYKTSNCPVVKGTNSKFRSLHMLFPLSYFPFVPQPTAS